MVWSVVARGGRIALGFASGIIVVRTLGPHDYGVLSLVRALLMFAVVLVGAGMGQAILKFLPETRVASDAAAARRLLRTAVAINLVVWAALVTASYLTRGALESFFPYEGLGVIVTAAFALALFEVFFVLIARILEAGYDTKRLSFASIAGHVVYIAALLVVLPRGGAVLGVLAAAAAGNVVACSILLAPARAALAGGGETADGGAAGATPSQIPLGRLFRFSAPLVLVGLLVQVVWRQSETIFLGYFRTAEETGFFDLAYRLPQQMLEFVPTAVWPLVMAGFSELYARNASEMGDAIDRYYRMLFMLCTPICAVGIVLGGVAVPIVFTPEMAPAAVPTQVFFAIFTVSFFGTPLSMTLYVLEKTHLNLIVYLCLAAVNVGLDLLLIPKYGVAGAIVPVALVTVAAPFVYRGIVGRYVANVRIPFGFIGRCFLASGAVLLLAPFTRFVTGAAHLAVALALAGVLIVLAFRVFRVVGEREREMLGAVPIPGADRLLKFIAPS